MREGERIRNALILMGTTMVLLGFVLGLVGLFLISPWIGAPATVLAFFGLCYTLVRDF